MEQDILSKALYYSEDSEERLHHNAIDEIYNDYKENLYLKNKGWSNFTHAILISFNRLQSYAEFMVKEYNIPQTYQIAVERYEEGRKQMEEIYNRQIENSFSENILIDIFENEKYHLKITSQVFMAVVNLIHLQEKLMKDFFYNHFFGSSLWKYIYNEHEIKKEINKIFSKQKKVNSHKNFNKDLLLKKLSSSHSMGFSKALSLVDRKKYKINNCSFYNLIFECNYFCNYLKHQPSEMENESNEKENELLKDRIFYPVVKNNSGIFCEDFFSLEVFFQYIKAFEDFWMYILENSVNPEDRDEYTDTMIIEYRNRFKKSNKKFTWHQK